MVVNAALQAKPVGLVLILIVCPVYGCIFVRIPGFNRPLMLFDLITKFHHIIVLQICCQKIIFVEIKFVSTKKTKTY
jgi:hypothetical protein